MEARKDEIIKACKDEIIKACNESKDGIIKAIEKGPTKYKIKEHIKETQVKPMDDLVTVNSLFTIAVFVGLAFATPGQRSLENRDECNAGVNAAKRLILFEVSSFAFFLLSSLVAKSLKFNLYAYRKRYFTDARSRSFNTVMLYACPLASLLGCSFLVLSMVDVIQIRLGKLTCGTFYSLTAAVSLIVIVFLAILFYIRRTTTAIHRSMEKLDELLQESEIKKAPNRQVINRQ